VDCRYILELEVNQVTHGSNVAMEENVESRRTQVSRRVVVLFVMTEMI
jgi:hypothetical protein